MTENAISPTFVSRTDADPRRGSTAVWRLGEVLPELLARYACAQQSARQPASLFEAHGGTAGEHVLARCG